MLTAESDCDLLGEADDEVNYHLAFANDPINNCDPTGLLPVKVASALQATADNSQVDAQIRSLARQALALEAQINAMPPNASDLFQQQVGILKQIPISINGSANAWDWAQAVAKEDAAQAALPPGPPTVSEGTIRGHYPNLQIYHGGQWTSLEGYSQDHLAAAEASVVTRAYVRGYIDVAIFAATEGTGELLSVLLRGAKPAVEAVEVGETAASEPTLSTSLKTYRESTGIPRTDTSGGTVGVARTDLPQLESETFTGASPQARPPGTEVPQGPFTSPNRINQGHAEEVLSNKLDAAIQQQALTPAQMEGSIVSMRIEQEVCATCKSGLANPRGAAGVLKQLSQKYPGITFKITAEGTDEVIILKNGQIAR